MNELDTLSASADSLNCNETSAAAEVVTTDASSITEMQNVIKHVKLRMLPLPTQPARLNVPRPAPPCLTLPRLPMP